MISGSMQKEIWKDIPEYEGMYQVSSEGRVKSLERYVKHWTGGLKKLTERYRMLSKNTGGYSVVNLCKDGKVKKYPSHILVAMAFLNHKPSGHSVVVDHIDNDISNNRLSNLQLISSRKNSTKDKKPKSGFAGVIKTKSGRYQSRILHKKQQICLGMFDTPEEAHQAYLNKIKEIEG
jgi:hypothetical protein